MISLSYLLPLFIIFIGHVIPILILLWKKKKKPSHLSLERVNDWQPKTLLKLGKEPAGECGRSTNLSGGMKQKQLLYLLESALSALYVSQQLLHLVYVWTEAVPLRLTHSHSGSGSPRWSDCCRW